MKLLQIMVLALIELLAGCAGTPPSVATSSEQVHAPTSQTQVPPEALDSRVLKLKTQLNLNERQATQLDAIFKETEAQQRELTKQRSIIHNKSADLQQKKLQRINSVLTAEQAKKYERIRNAPPEEVMKAHEALESQSPQHMK